MNLTIETRNVNEALRYARTAERAANMESDGYAVSVSALFPELVFVHKPLDADGFQTGLYAVDAVKKTCNCPDFDKHRDYCKHLLFAEKVEAEAERIEMWSDGDFVEWMAERYAA